MVSGLPANCESFSGPANRKMFQSKRVAAGSLPASVQRMMWPQRLFSRGLALSVTVRPLLLVSVKYTCPLRGSIVPHSERSMRVAPTRSAASRVFTSTSAWLLKVNGVSGPCPKTSGSHTPVPSSLNLATYRVPSSSSAPLATPRAFWYTPLETNL